LDLIMRRSISTLLLCLSPLILCSNAPETP
jgi:hypothetical protein